MNENHAIPKRNGFTLVDGYFIESYTSSGDITTEAIPMHNREFFSVSFSCPSTGSPEGTITAYLCNDREIDYLIPDDGLVNWTPADGGSSALSGASLITIDCSKFASRWLRFVYSRSSGAITLTINAQFKGSL